MGNIRNNDGTESPPLKVLALEPFVQKDPMAGPADAVSEFNVLDRTLRSECLIETSDFFENRAADRPATGPERRSLRMAVLVHEMMQQVPILRNHPRGFRLVIIGAKDGGQLRFLRKDFGDHLNRPRSEDDIGVYEE